ncbi:MAG: aerobic-type carbon monoxide dehydrogenase small subunit (CoxS/CutS family) [Myxococcota bacterium]|jgi:aerobic-type carbon monoxide dehydrogenase small subunit (CoxS/CutS family)
MSHLLELEVNGEPAMAAIEPTRTLCELLRYDLRLTGTKQGCDKGDCGACTVLLDGQPVLSCITLAVLCEGRQVQTVEGLATAAGLHRAQTAFAAFGAGQCGFCTPGMLMSAAHFLDGLPPGTTPTRDEITHALSGNLCRCTGYTKIIDAVASAAAETP